MATNDPIPSRCESHLFATSEPRGGLFRLFPPATRAELWGGLAFIVLSLLGTVWVIKCRFEALALERDAVTIDGTVVRLWITPGRGSGLHHVAYEYPAPLQVEACTIHGETTLSDDHYSRLKEGGPIAVKVCRTDPPNHQVVGASTRVFASTAAFAFNLGVLALLALAGVINLWWWWISHRRLGPAQVFILGVKIVQ